MYAEVMVDVQRIMYAVVTVNFMDCNANIVVKHILAVIFQHGTQNMFVLEMDVV